MLRSILLFLSALCYYLGDSVLFRKHPLNNHTTFQIGDIVMLRDRPHRAGIIRNDSDFTDPSFHTIHLKLPVSRFHYMDLETDDTQQTLQRIQYYLNTDCLVMIPIHSSFQQQNPQLRVYGYSDSYIDAFLSMAKLLKLLMSDIPSDEPPNNVIISPNDTRIINLRQLKGPLFRTIFTQNIAEALYTILHLCDTKILTNVFHDMIQNVNHNMQQQLRRIMTIHKAIKKEDPNGYHPYFGNLQESTLFGYQAIWFNYIQSEFYIDEWVNIISVLIKQYSMKLNTSLSVLYHDETVAQDLESRIEGIQTLCDIVAENTVIEKLLFRIQNLKQMMENLYLWTILYEKMTNQEIPRDIHAFVTSEKVVERTMIVMRSWNVPYANHRLVVSDS